jgi:hypothetical protein
MLKIFFVAFVLLVMSYRLSTWLKIHRKISAAEHWQTIEGTLLDQQSAQKKGRLAKFQNNFDHYCFVEYVIDGKKFGCQQISFYDSSHNLNHDYLNELISREKDTVTVWYDGKAPGRSVLLSPFEHRKVFAMISNLFFFIAGLAMIVMAIIS